MFYISGMNRLVLISLIFFYVQNSTAQNYVPFPDSAAVWVNATLVVNQGFYGSYTCANGEDTLINGTSYTKMEDCITGDYRGAFRDSIGRVHYVPVDSTSEYLMYDFYPSPGDTLLYYQMEFGPELEEYIVQSGDTGTIQVNGEDRKAVTVGIGTWIEGIGSTKGLMMSQFDNVSNYGIWLYCMSANDTIQYGYSVSNGWGSPGQIINLPCDFYLDNEELSLNQFDVYPNPASDKVMFAIPGVVESVELIDASGRSFEPIWSFFNGEFHVSVESIPRGFYTVKVRTDKRELYAKLILTN